MCWFSFGARYDFIAFWLNGTLQANEFLLMRVLRFIFLGLPSLRLLGFVKLPGTQASPNMESSCTGLGRARLLA